MKISIISFRISSNIPSKIRPCGKERISAAYFDYDDVTEWIWFTIESFNCLNTFLLFFLLKGSILFIMSGGRWETFCVTIIFLSLFSSVDGLFFVFLFFFFFNEKGFSFLPAALSLCDLLAERQTFCHLTLHYGNFTVVVGSENKELFKIRRVIGE